MSIKYKLTQERKIQSVQVHSIRCSRGELPFAMCQIRRSYIIVTTPGTYFCQGLSRTHGHRPAGRIRPTEKCNDFTENRIRDLMSCSIMPQLTALPRAPLCSQYPVKDNEGLKYRAHYALQATGALPCLLTTVSLPLFLYTPVFFAL